MELKKQVAIVVGASGKLGRSVTKLLDGAGYRQLLIARNNARLAEVAGEIDAEMFPADATNEDELDVAFAHAGETLGDVGLVVDCIGHVNTSAVILRSSLSQLGPGSTLVLSPVPASESAELFAVVERATPMLLQKGIRLHAFLDCQESIVVALAHVIAKTEEIDYLGEGIPLSEMR